MPHLLLLNGPPGCGKSTIAQMYVAAHPLALNLDVDLVRRQIGGWQDQPERSGLLARRVALAAASVHLNRGHDVVVPQYLAKVDFIEQLEAGAADSEADFHELVLMTSRDVAVRRFEERTLAAADRTHVEAASMAEREGGPDPIGAMYDRLLALVAIRPNAVLVPVRESDAASTYNAVMGAIKG